MCDPGQGQIEKPLEGTTGHIWKEAARPWHNPGVRGVLKSPWDTYLDRNGRVCVCVCVVRPEKSVPLNCSVWGLGLWYLVVGCP